MVKYLVFDTSSLIRIVGLEDPIKYISKIVGEDYFFIVVPRDVLSEVGESIRFFLDVFSDKILVLDVSPKYVKDLEKVIKEFGIKKLLSRVDISVLALSLQVKKELKDVEVIIFSEDFDIQNFAKILGVEFLSIMDRKIKSVLRIKKKCLSCGKVYTDEYESCPDCGSREYKLIYIRSRK